MKPGLLHPDRFNSITDELIFDPPVLIRVTVSIRG